MEFNRKVLPLKEYKSYKALCAFQRLIFGLQMIPGNMQYSYEEFCAIIEKMSPEDQLKTVTQAAKMVTLDEDEVNALVCFCTDKNGIPYTSENKKTLSPSDIVEIIVTVSMHILSDIHIDLLSNEEKKNLKTSQLTSVAPS